MKSNFLLLYCALSALCGKSNKSFAQIKPDTIRISLKTTSGMQFDLVRFSVKPGNYVKIILTNTDEMEHNLVIGKQDSREKIVDAASALGKFGPAANYVPKIDAVLWSILILQGGQSDSILFRAPRNTGVYPYVCTLPGHGGIMYGAMHVTNGIMPELIADLNIPPHRRKAETTSHTEQTSGHPFKLVPPYLYRVLMPDAGPASIAVCLPHKMNYCWDAGACRLRYIWSGEFLDLTDYWTVKGELHAKILGSIFYKDHTRFPFRINSSDTLPNIKFKGYRLIKGIPEFHYTMNDLEVFEMIESKENGAAIVRHFHIHGAKEPIWFIHEANDGMDYRSDQGVWTGTQLKLEPNETSSFSITMIKTNQ